VNLGVSEIFRVLPAGAYAPGRFKQTGQVWGRGGGRQDKRHPQSLQVEIGAKYPTLSAFFGHSAFRRFYKLK